MGGPLEGFRVIDATQMVSGPMATMILGDQGADVIKLEPPGSGDFTRGLGGRRPGLGPIFLSTNRSKRSIAIDLGTPAGRELAVRVAATADVFVQNFRPGVADRLGIGEPALRAARPDLVYVSISGFGETGPYASKRVYDPVVQALSGLASIQADRETGRPRMVRVIVSDKVTALTAAQAITAALLERERTGRGQHLRLSMLDAVVSFLWPEGMARYTHVGNEPGMGPAHDARDLVFETADGFVTVGAVSDREWAGLCRALERPEWITDERFATVMARIRNTDERLEVTESVLRSRPSAEWLERLDREDVPCAPIVSREELLVHPQVEASGLIVESDHPHAGRIRQPRPAARFEGTVTDGRPAPLLGEHTGEVLREIGLADAHVAELREAGTVA